MKASFGRGLFGRFYLYQVVLVAVCVVVGLAVRYTINRTQDRDRNAVIYIAERTLRERDDLPRLQRELDDMGRLVQVRVSLYDTANAPVAHAGDALPPLDARALERLANGAALDLSGGAVAVRDGDAYAIVKLIGSNHAVLNALNLFGLLCIIALGNIPFVRSIARPLQELSDAAKAFGAGDMRARARLARRDEIGQLARAFDDMADAVETARMAEKELLANVSHELRTPLARIRVVHELAAERFPDVAQRWMTEIATDLGELERLIDAIIASARLDLEEARGGELGPSLALESLGIGMYVEDIAARFAERHPERKLELEIDYELSALADRGMLRRAIDNVLANANAYSTPGQPIRIVVTRDDDARAVEIRVADEGPGIAAADLPRIGTPFFRTDRSRSRNTGGTGLGLSLSRRILENHRGSLRIQSVPDVGTTVALALPLNPGP